MKWLRVSMVLAMMAFLGGTSQSQASVIVGPTTFPNVGVSGQTSWGIQFTALQTSVLTGFEFHHRSTLSAPGSQGTITLFDVTAGNSAYSTPWGLTTAGVIPFSGLSVLLTKDHIYTLTTTSSVGGADVVFQYDTSLQFSYPSANSDIKVTGPVYSPSVDAFTQAHTWPAFGNITTSAAAVPEPTSIALFGLTALAGLGWCRRRMQNPSGTTEPVVA